MFVKYTRNLTTHENFNNLQETSNYEGFSHFRSNGLGLGLLTFFRTRKEDNCLEGIEHVWVTKIVLLFGIIILCVQVL